MTGAFTMTHTITIEGLTEEEFARITDLLKGEKHNGVIFPEPNKIIRAASDYNMEHSIKTAFVQGALWCIESTEIQ